MGLVDRLVAPDDVYSEALARRGVRGDRRTRLAAKDAIDGPEVPLDTWRSKRQQFAALFATEDRGIGMTSFVEHGPGKAKFVGR